MGRRGKRQASQPGSAKKLQHLSIQYHQANPTLSNPSPLTAEAPLRLRFPQGWIVDECRIALNPVSGKRPFTGGQPT
jgi:hypothetical protein